MSNHRRRALAIAASALLVATVSPAAHAHQQPTPAAAQTASWSLAADMEAHPELNPFPDMDGHADTWGLYAADVDADPSTATLLPEYADNICATGAATGWRENGYLPVIGVNSSDTDGSCGTSTAPAHSVLAHPWPTRDAVIGWTAPVATTVAVSGWVADDDPYGGNGIGYRLVLGATTLDEGVIDDGGSADFASSEVQVTAGERIYLTINARNGNSDYDLTRVDLTITGPSTPPTATLRSATPASVAQGTTSTVTLTGSGFGAQTQVALDDPTGIEIGTPTVVSSKKLRVPVAVSGDAPATSRHWQVFEDGTARATCPTPTACSLTVTGTPRVDSISPSNLQRGQGGDFVLTGSGFATGMSVKVSGPGVTVGAVAVDGPATARVHLDAATTARLGRRTVTVTNPGGAKSALKRALTIVR